MINFIDEKGVKHSAIVECKKTKGVNGEKSLSGTIYTNDEILEGIGRGWRLEFENEKYCLTYVYPIDEGNQIVVEFDAVHEFFFDLNKKVVYTELNGSNTAKAYLDLIFNGSGYSYVTEVNIPAFEKEGFGMRNRLDLFKEFISSTGVEFSVNGKVVRILEKVGSNLSTIVKKGFNLNELRIEKDPGSFITYKKGFGAWVDDDDHSKGRLEVEYLSPLASIYGKLEGDPIIDERYKVASNFETRLKNEVESSYGISVDIDMEDLTRAGYEYEQPHEGDYIMAINKDLAFEQKIRIMSYETSYDTNGNIIDHKVSCGSDNIIRKSIKEDDEFRKEIQAGLEGAISTSNKAWVSANGKNAVFEGPEEPTATAIGDIWYQIDGEEKIMRIWNGYEWKPVFNPGEIEKKVEQAEQEVQTAIDQSNTAINNASQAIADAGFAKNQSATALSQAGQAVADANSAIVDAKSALDAYNNMSYENRNLLRNTSYFEGFNHWSMNSTIREIIEDSIYGKCLKFHQKGNVPVNDRVFARSTSDHEIGKKYILGFYAKSDTNILLNVGWYSELKVVELSTNWQYFEVELTAKSIDAAINFIVGAMNVSVYLTKVKFEKGSKATPWSAAPEDVQVQITNINGELSQKVSQNTFNILEGTVSTQGTQINQNKADILLKANQTSVNALNNQVSAINTELGVQAGSITALNTKTDGHTTQIGSLESSFSGLNSTVSQVQMDLNGKLAVTEFTSFQQNVNGFMTDVQNNKADKTTVNQLATQWQTTTVLAEGHTSQISSLGDSIDLRVSKDDVINQINISKESILIAGQKIHITGDTFIDNGVIKTAMIGDAQISGAKIADATIGSAKIISLDANKISVNTLSAITTNTGALNVSGNLTMTTDNTQIIGSYAYTEAVGDAYRPRRFEGVMNLGRRFTGFTGDVWWAESGNTAKVGYATSFYGLDYLKQRIYTDNSRNTLLSRIDVYNGQIEFSKYWGMGEASSTIIGNTRVETPTVVANVALRTGRISPRSDYNTFIINEDGTNRIPTVTLSNGDGGFSIVSNSQGARMNVGKDSSAARVWFPTGVYNRTYNSGPAVCITDAGTLGRIVSARKYKTDIEVASDLIQDARKVLQLTPKSWVLKKDKAYYGAEAYRAYGFIADEVDELGLKHFVQYHGKTGEVEGLSNGMLTTYHNVILKDHDQAISQLNADYCSADFRIRVLEDKVNKLEEALRAA